MWNQGYPVRERESTAAATAKRIGRFCGADVSLKRMADVLGWMFKVLSVMATACLYFWGGIPAGLALRFSLPVSAFLTAAGACAGVLGLTLAGGPVQRWVVRHFAKQFERFRRSRIMGLWERFGVTGFCLLSPALTGAPQAALLAIMLGAPPRKVLLWTCLGVLLFTAGLLAVYAFGAEVMALIRTRQGG